MNILIQERPQGDDSPLSTLDPRVKVVIALLMIVGVLLTPMRAAPAYLLIWGIIATLAVIGRLGIWRLARLGGVVLPFTLASVTLLFTTPGATLATIGGQTITEPGLVRFLSTVIRSWLSVQISLMLILTTPFTDILWALQSLKVPAVLVAVISLTYRYLFTLKEEAQRVMTARAARSGSLARARSGGSLLWRGRVAGNMAGSLFLRGFERADRVYTAMLARGYNGQIRLLQPPTLTHRAILRGLVPLAAIVLVEIMAYLWWNV